MKKMYLFALVLALAMLGCSHEQEQITAPGFSEIESVALRSSAAYPAKDRIAYAYNGPSSTLPQNYIDAVADHFDYLIGEYGTNHATHVAASADFKNLIYNSLTDNVANDGEDTYTAANYPYNDEDLYLHWADSTVITYGGPTSTQYTYAPGDRVTVYNPSRMLPSFHTQDIIDVRIDYINQLLTSNYNGGSYPPDGVYFDNAVYGQVNQAALKVHVVSGGAVEEHPTNAVINTQSFHDWYYRDSTASVDQFLRQLRTDLNGTKTVACNMGGTYPGSWLLADTYGNGAVCDAWVWEFEPKTSFWWDLSSVSKAYNFGANLSNVGSALWVSPQLNGYQSTPASDAKIYDAWGFWLSYKAPDMRIMPDQFTNNPDYDFDRWVEVEADHLLYQNDLGVPTSAPYVVYDSGGARVYRRDYEDGLVLFRPKGGTSGYVSVQLGGNYLKVRDDGTTNPVVRTSMNLYQEDAGIFWNYGGSGDPCPKCPDPTGDSLTSGGVFVPTEELE